MRRILTAVALSSVALLAHAERDTCAELADAAEAAMQARQLGLTMLELSRSMDEAGVPAAQKKVAMSIAAKAYKKPIVEGSEAKLKAAQEFGNEAYIGCTGG
jgi:hypothetical protein